MISKIRYFFFLLITGLTIGAILALWGRDFSKDNIEQTSHEVVQENVADSVSRKKEKMATEKQEPKNKEENVPPLAKQQKQAVKPKPRPDYTIQCIDEDFDLKTYLNVLASHMEAQKIRYNSEALSDCSGIFLRVCQDASSLCPDADFPNPKKVRDGRRLARWYYDRGRLTLVKDAEAYAEYIRPGAVMFYGHRNKKYDKVNIQNITARTGIEHVGIVTDVERDTSGQIVNYTLFHGRSSGKIASRTTHHHREPSRKSLPAFGNYNQQWVAVAYLIDEPFHPPQADETAN